MECWDLIVAGGGPAGATAALAALHRDPGARVLVLDKATFPRDKACGDGIAPHGLDELADLGAAGLTDGFTPVRRVRITTPGGRAVLGIAARENWVIPRAVFDARLLDAAKARGAVVRRTRVRSVAQDHGAVVVNGELRAPVLVGADGANSAVRRLLGGTGPRPGHLAIAIRGYARAPAGEPVQHIGMVADGWPAYAWSFPVGDGTANVGYGLLRNRMGPDVDLASRLAAALPDQPADAATLRAHHLPFSSGGTRLGRGRVLLAGDAANMVNPLTGEGIFAAVATGRAAGTAAGGPAPLAAYRRLVRGRLGANVRQTAVLARLIRWRPIIEAAVVTASRHPGVFDELVELGLADGILSRRSLGRVAAHLRLRSSPDAR